MSLWIQGHSFPKRPHHFVFPPATREGSSCSTSSEHLLMSGYNHFAAWVVASHCGFDSRFPDDWCSCVHWPSAYLPVPTICPSLSPVLKNWLVCIIDLWRRQWHPTPVLLPGKSHGQRSLVGFSPWGRKESDTTERLLFYFSLPCTGEGNGNPLQCSCLENPRDGRAWWAAIYGVAQSRTRL